MTNGPAVKLTITECHNKENNSVRIAVLNAEGHFEEFTFNLQEIDGRHMGTIAISQTWIDSQPLIGRIE